MCLKEKNVRKSLVLRDRLRKSYYSRTKELEWYLFFFLHPSQFLMVGLNELNKIKLQILPVGV